MTVLGLTKVLGTLGAWFSWIRWIGVAYLIYLGLKLWRASAVDLNIEPPEPKSARAIYLQALLVSLMNPKTLLFYGAFFPQFVSPQGNIGRQLAILSATFLLLAIVMDSSWAILAGRMRRFLTACTRLRNRIGGGMLIGAGIGLAVARNK